MKSLIGNYVDQLSKEKLNEFGIKNDIYLSNSELEYLLNLVKNHWQEILQDETIYLKELKNNINEKNIIKIKDLFLYYKKRYKGYLF